MRTTLFKFIACTRTSATQLRVMKILHLENESVLKRLISQYSRAV